jgi:eukaryotic-like serine/threonine-protein kinase
MKSLEDRLCVQCNGAMPPARSGSVCPRCLVAAVLNPPAEEEQPPAGPIVGEFGEYDLLNVAGRGGMGVVYRARHRRLGREVALKMVASPVMAGESAARRFRAEVESMGSLDHPHIIPVYEFGEVEGQAYYTMKFIDGGHLSARLRETAWPLVDRIRLLMKVTRAVDHAHRHGVLHRDLKPSNIMIDGGGEPYVCDFGLARRLEGDSSLTLSGAALGTPEYMAPEQAIGDTSSATTAADVYSLGAILYECLAGRPPFRGGNALETMRQVMEQEPAVPSTVSRGADRDLETVAIKCLSKEPSRRYASAAALADDMERWLRHEPVTARRPGPVERTSKWLRRHPGLAAIFVVLAVSAGVFVWQRLREEERVKSERDRAEAGWAASRARHYAADMDAVADAIDRGDYGVAVAKLLANLPAPGESDQRGLEWYIYERATSGSQFQRFEAGSMVRHLAWSPDETQLAAATAREQVHFWNVADGSLLATIPDKSIPNEWDLNFVKAKELARSARRGAGAQAALLNLVGAGQVRNPSTNRAPAANGLAFSPDGKILATADHEGTKFWRLKDRWLYDWLPRYGGAGAFLDNARYLATDEKPPHALGIFDLNTGEWRVLHENAGSRVTVSEDRRRAAVINNQTQALTVFSLPDGSELGRWQDEAFLKAQRVTLLADDGGFLVRSSGMLRTLEGDWRQRRWRRSLGEGRFTDSALFALSRDGAWLAMYDQQYRLRLHNAADGSQEMLLRGARSPLAAMAWAPSRSILATGEENGTVRLWEAGHVDRSWQVGKGGIEPAVTLSPDGMRAAVRTSEGGIAALDLNSGEQSNLPGTHGAVPVAITDDGTLLFLIRQPSDSLLVLQELRSGTPAVRAVFRDSQQWPLSRDHSATLSAGRWLIISEGDRHLRICDITDGSLMWKAGADWDPLRASLSPDARTLAFSQNRTLRLLDWPSGNKRAEIDAAAPVLSLAWLRNGGSIAAGGGDGVIRLFSTDDLHTTGSLTGHTGGVSALCVSADGTRLASFGANSRVRLWDLPTLQALGRLPLVDIGPRSLAGFTHADRGVAAVMWGGPLVIWRPLPANKSVLLQR